jgi:hypothetical protein
MSQVVQGRAIRCVRWPKKLAARTTKTICKCNRVQTWACSDRRLGARLIAEKLNMRVFGGKNQNSGLTRGFSTMMMLLRMMG